MTDTRVDSPSRDRLIRLLLTDRATGRARTAALIARTLAGLLFLLSTVPKFADHHHEIDEFVRYGLPRSSALVYAVAGIEIVAGLLLVLGLATRLAAAAMALNMTGAVLTAGVHVGGAFHLGVAPLLLATCLFIVWAGPGAKALDRKLLTRLTSD